QVSQQCSDFLGLWTIHRDFIDHDDVTSLRLSRQCRAQSSAPHLTRHLLAIAAWLWPVGNAATHKNRGAPAAMTCTASALLAINLRCRIADVAAPFRLVRAAASICQLAHQRLVHQASVYFCFKNSSRKLNTVY